MKSRTLRYGALVFDLDGVLIDSADIKAQTFQSFYSHLGADLRGKVYRYLELHSGLSRSKKFTHIEQEILGRTGTGDEIALLCRKFADQVLMTCSP